MYAFVPEQATAAVQPPLTQAARCCDDQTTFDGAILKKNPRHHCLFAEFQSFHEYRPQRRVIEQATFGKIDTVELVTL